MSKKKGGIYFDFNEIFGEDPRILGKLSDSSSGSSPSSQRSICTPLTPDITILPVVTKPPPPQRISSTESKTCSEVVKKLDVRDGLVKLTEEKIGDDTPSMITEPSIGEGLTQVVIPNDTANTMPTLNNTIEDSVVKKKAPRIIKTVSVDCLLSKTTPVSEEEEVVRLISHSRSAGMISNSQFGGNATEDANNNTVTATNEVLRKNEQSPIGHVGNHVADVNGSSHCLDVANANGNAGMNGETLSEEYLERAEHILTTTEQDQKVEKLDVLTLARNIEIKMKGQMEPFDANEKGKTIISEERKAIAVDKRKSIIGKPRVEIPVTKNAKKEPSNEDAVKEVKPINNVLNEITTLPNKIEPVALRKKKLSLPVIPTSLADGDRTACMNGRVDAITDPYKRHSLNILDEDEDEQYKPRSQNSFSKSRRQTLGCSGNRLRPVEKHSPQQTNGNLLSELHQHMIQKKNLPVNPEEGLPSPNDAPMTTSSPVLVPTSSALSPVAATIERRLPPDWQEATSPEGLVYYYNEKTHETTWSFPTPATSHVSPVRAVPNLDSGSHDSLGASISSLNERRSSSSLNENRSISTGNMSGGSSSSVTDEGTAMSSSSRSLSKRGSVASLGRVTNQTPSPYGSHGSMDALNDGTLKKKKQRHNQKPFFFTYPKSEELAEQSLLDVNRVSYCDHFWEDYGETPGYDVVKKHIERGNSMLKEMAEFFRERASIEEMYSKNLERLSKMTLGDHEGGTLGKAWQQLKRNIEEESRSRLKYSVKLTQTLEKELADYAEGTPAQRKQLKKLDQQLLDDRKLVYKNFAKIDEHRVALADKQTKAAVKQGTTPHKEATKAKIKVANAGDEYKRSIEVYNESQRKWIEDMTTNLLDYEKVETSRIDFAKKQLLTYISYCREAETRQEKSFNDTEQALDRVEPADDIADFVERRGTGEVRPVDIKI